MNPGNTYAFTASQTIGLDHEITQLAQERLNLAVEPAEDTKSRVSRNVVFGKEFAREGLARFYPCERLCRTDCRNLELRPQLVDHSSIERFLWTNKYEVWSV